MKTARNAAGDTAITARNATGDTAMPEGEVTPPMMTHPVRKAVAGGATAHAAIGAETDAGTTPSDSEGYHTESDEELRRPSRHRRTAARGDERRPTVIRPLNDLFTKAVNYKTYRLERCSARYDSTVAMGYSTVVSFSLVILR